MNGSNVQAGSCSVLAHDAMYDIDNEWYEKTQEIAKEWVDKAMNKLKTNHVELKFEKGEVLIALCAWAKRNNLLELQDEVFSFVKDWTPTSISTSDLDGVYEANW